MNRGQSLPRSQRHVICRFLGTAIAAMLIAVLALAGNSGAQEQGGTAQLKSPGLRYSVQIEPVTADKDQLPADFAMAIYEELVNQITKTGKFDSVFRSGDKRASEVPNLLILTSKVQSFQRGSQTKRAVTTVAGATKITVTAQLATRDSQVRFERTVDGKVRLFGENMKATQVLAKNIAKSINVSSLDPH